MIQETKKKNRLLIMKFGGTSVGSADAILRTSKIIQDYQNSGKSLVVVVSAMKGVTNLLVEGANLAATGVQNEYENNLTRIAAQHTHAVNSLALPSEIHRELEDTIQVYLDRLGNYCASIQTMGEITPRGMDSISSMGERINARILTAVLTAKYISCQAVDADDIIITDDNFQNAHPQMDVTQKKVQNKLAPMIKTGSIPIVTGFMGGTKDGVTTTLGRGGSDYTAAILGACLDASEVWTWTDVDGVMTADPSMVENAKVIENLSFEEVSEMAYFGAKVLHPKTMRPLLEKDIPLCVKNTFNPSHDGTLISKESKNKSGKISCVTAIPDVSLVTVRGKGMLGVPGVAARTFSAVAREGASVLMISQSSSEQSICFVIPTMDEQAVVQSLNHELEFELSRGDIDAINSQCDVVIVTAIGAGMRHTPGVSARIFGALGKRNINVIAIAQGSSEYSISLVVSAEEAQEAVRQVHSEVIINGN